MATSAPAIVKTPPPLVEVLCPVCTNAGFRRVIVRASKGAVVEAFCWKCKYRAIVRVTC